MTPASAERVQLPAEIPLFPLKLVLFPDGVLQLKLFEARYLDMAARCMRTDSPFGVCLIREGREVGEVAQPHDLGSMATIVDWDMSQPGLLFITTRGGPRFRIIERKIQSDRLQTARVSWLDEPPPQPVPEHLAGAVPLLRAIVADAGPDAFAQPHRQENRRFRMCQDELGCIGLVLMGSVVHPVHLRSDQDGRSRTPGSPVSPVDACAAAAAGGDTVLAL